MLWLLEVVLHGKRRVWSQAELNDSTQWTRLREDDKIAQGKCCSHRLMNCERHTFLWLLRRSWLKQHIASAHVALHTEGDSFLAGLDLHGLAKLLQVLANLLKLAAGQLSNHLVVLLRNLHVFALDLHQLQVKVCNPVLFAALTLETDHICILLPLELQRITWATHLQDLRKRLDVHSKWGCPFALECRERRLSEHQRDQGNV
mmetsp:Transcript_33861/g.77279  ORF Transcript_33861/g.77279 Transcript_33861/m.77279 type:complete len:203 (+) Transcript_33861:234-842(+)